VRSKRIDDKILRISHFSVDKSGLIRYKALTLAELGGATSRRPPRQSFSEHPIVSIKSRWQERRRRKAAQDALGEMTERAARLGITPERVLEEYRRIAFANLSHIVHWSDTGMSFKPDGELDPDDIAAIAEIVESAKEGKPYRVKLYDKKAALDAIARYLGMAPPPVATTEDEPTRDDGDEHRAALILELDRLAAQMAKRSADRKPQS
jgi:hypothetical protein